MRPYRLFTVLLSALALAACARQVPRYASAPQPRFEPRAEARSALDVRMYGAPQPLAYAAPRKWAMMQAPVADIAQHAPYTLDSGDKLRIVVFGQDALSNNYLVDADGMVSLPLIGRLSARGLTTAQLASAIAGRLRQSYIRDPSVAVEVETHRPFFVLGEVTYPGQYPYVPNMTVENAIAIAGGFTPRAKKDRVVLTRKVHGQPLRYAMPLQYPLRPGDTITVTERWF